jgi:hypothetical protein
VSGALYSWHTLDSLWTGLDKGGADFIASGQIKIKQGIQPIAFSENSIIFADGSELPADAVIFAYVLARINTTSTPISRLITEPATRISVKSTRRFSAKTS